MEAGTEKPVLPPGSSAGSIPAPSISLIQREACFSQRHFWKGQTEASGKPWAAFLEEEASDEEEEEEDGAMSEGSSGDS